MIDDLTLKECKASKEILELKINNLEFAIDQSEEIIRQSNIDQNTLSFLRRKVAESLQDLETLYLLRNEFFEKQ